MKTLHNAQMCSTLPSFAMEMAARRILQKIRFPSNTSKIFHKERLHRICSVLYLKNIGNNRPSAILCAASLDFQITQILQADLHEISRHYNT